MKTLIGLMILLAASSGYMIATMSNSYHFPQVQR